MLESFPDRGQIRFQKFRDAGGVLNAVIAFVRRNAREMLVGFFALVAPFAIITGIGSALYLRRFSALFADPEAFASGTGNLGDMFGPAYFVTILGSLLAFAIAQATIAGYVRLYREGEAGDITIGLLWDETRGLILPVIGLFALAFGLMTVSGLIAVVPCLGALVWVGFCIWVSPYIHVAFASRMTEATTIGEAIQRALALVKGSWGYAFGSLLLAWIVSYAIIIALSIPLYVVFAVIGLNSASGGDPTEAFNAMSVFMAPLQILGMAAYILPSLAAFFVHGRLAEELDGPGVEDDLDVLEQGVDAAPTAAWTAPAPPPARGGAAPPDDAPDSTPSGNDDTPPASGGGFRGGGFDA